MLREIDPDKVEGPSFIDKKIVSMNLTPLSQLQKKFIDEQTPEFKEKLKKDKKLRAAMIKFTKTFKGENQSDMGGNFETEISLINLLKGEAESLIKEYNNIEAMKTLFDLLKNIRSFEEKYEQWKRESGMSEA